MCRKGPKCRLINLDGLVDALPAMLSATRLVFRLTISPPNELLAAAAAIPNLQHLDFEEARLDGPLSLPVLQSFTRLRQMTMTIVTQLEGTPVPTDIDIMSERNHIKTLLRAVSSHLSHLEIAGDLLDLSELASMHWPHLQTFIISGHQPGVPHLHLSSFIAGMPHLTDLSLRFSALHGTELPPFVSYPPHYHALCLSSVVPELTSISLSNVFPEDRILGQLPCSLT